MPLILVGLVDGGVALVEVQKTTSNLAPEIQILTMERGITGMPCCHAVMFLADDISL